MDALQDVPGVVVIMAVTNVPHFLDKALVAPGRFDRTVYVGPPTKLHRQTILAKIVKKSKMPISTDVFNYVSKLADLTEDYTGADLYHLCSRAGLHALNRLLSQQENKEDMPNVTVTIEDFTYAVNSKISVSGGSESLVSFIFLAAGGCPRILYWRFLPFLIW